MIAKFGMACVVGFITLAPATQAGATTFPVGSDNFFITSGTPTSPSITAQFMNAYTATTASFDDLFTFTIPQNGVGSGSISTSFSSALNKLTITDLFINGTRYDVNATNSGQTAAVGFIPIVSGILNTIEVKGFTVGAGGYTGTATFSAAVPEPASWAMMVGGFGLLGAALRRKRIEPIFAR